jgi:hypothetical protein
MKYCKKMSKCMNGDFKKRMSQFTDYWDTLMNKMSEFKKDQSFAKIRYDIILKQLENCSLFDLLVMNIEYENNIALFFKFFKQYVIEKDDSQIVQMIENLSSSIPKIAQTTEDIIFSTIDALTGNKVVSSVVRTVIDATKLALESKSKVLIN